MKKLALLLALLMLLSLSACSGKPAGTAPTDAPAADAEKRINLSDLTVQTADGGTLVLSDVLKEKELVFINLWATWCGFCVMEFPYLQEAYEQYADRVEVLALSVEEGDTPEVIRDFAAKNGLTFPMGSAVGTILESFVQDGIPTSLIVDRNGFIADTEVGAQTSARAFTALFDAYTGAAGTSDEAQCTYTVLFISPDGAPVPGCTATFCTDDVCIPAQDDGTGKAVFTGAAATYSVKLVTVPEGWTAVQDTELEAGPFSQTLTFLLQPAP